MIRHTIVGAGQAGGILAYNLLKRNIPVRIFDAGNKVTRPNAQVPWGWFRRVSLQQKVRVHKSNLNLPFEPRLTRGPMLVTTSDYNRVGRWKEWMNKVDTDAKILTPRETNDIYDIPIEHFGEENGGTFVCDSGDFIIDLQGINHEIWDYLENHPDCELHSNAHVDKVDTVDDNTVLTINGEKIATDKTIISVGNYTGNLLGSYSPIVKMTLPWAITTTPEQKKFIALWTQDSSIQMFSDGFTKIGCGSNAILSDVNVSELPYFYNMGKKGISNTHIPFPGTNDRLLDGSIKELESVGIMVKETERDSCDVDMTPTFCPVARFYGNQNTMVIGGFSGSGFTVYEGWFSESVLKSLESGQIDEKLRPFGERNLQEHLNPKEDEKSYVFV
jgi:hypothetical protein